MNKTILSGNLSRDVEIKYSQGGTAIANTGIATNRKYKSQTGEQKEEVMFIDLTFFGRTAEIANQYLRKGSKVLVDGILTLEQWTAQDGSKRSKHSITVENLEMIGSRDSDGQPSQRPESQNNNNEPAIGGAQPQSQSMPEIDIDQTEIPF